MTRRRFLLFYSLFLLLATTHFFINAPTTFFDIPEDEAWVSRWYNWFNEPVIIGMNFMYLLFLQSFYADVPKTRVIQRMFVWATYVVVSLLFLFIIFTVLDVNRDLIFFGINIVSVFPAIAIISVAYKFRFPFSRLLFYGLMCYVLGTLLTMGMNLLRNMEVKHLLTFGYPLLFIRLGILADLFFLLMVILEKWDWQEKQLAVEKITAQLDLEKLRTKIASELHDDLGASISGLSMYGHLANEQLNQQNIVGVRQSLSVIKESAAEMVNNLNEIVWLINVRRSTLPDLVQHLEEYARKMSAAKNMQLVFNFSETSIREELSIELRRNIYLFCKEAINNAVKYSGGSILELSILGTDNMYTFTVKDNGKGFDPNAIQKGNGLNNLQARAEEMNAVYAIASSEAKGCGVFLSLEITQ